MKNLGNEVDIVELVHDGGDQKVVYLKMKAFGPASAREMVLMHCVFKKGNRTYVGYRSCDFPCKLADSKAVRAFV